MVVFVTIPWRRNFHYLLINRCPTADNAEDGKDGDKYPPCPQPIVEKIADPKTKKNTPSHRQAYLHDHCKAFGPFLVFF